MLLLLVKIGNYIGFCVYRRSYLLWSPVIDTTGTAYTFYEVEKRKETLKEKTKTKKTNRRERKGIQKT